MLLKNQEQTQKLRKRTFFCEMWPRGKLNGGRNYKNSAGFIFSRQVIFFSRDDAVSRRICKKKQQIAECQVVNISQNLRGDQQNLYWHHFLSASLVVPHLSFAALYKNCKKARRPT